MRTEKPETKNIVMRYLRHDKGYGLLRVFETDWTRFDWRNTTHVAGKYFKSSRYWTEWIRLLCIIPCNMHWYCCRIYTMPTGISAKHRRNSPTSLSNIVMDRYVKCCRLVANLACTVPASSDSVRSTILLTEHHVVEHDITVSKLPSLSEFSKYSSLTTSITHLLSIQEAAM